MLSRATLLLLILFSAVSASTAVPLEGQGEGTLSRFLYDYAIAIALIVSYSVVALGHMAARIFTSRELEVWSNIELREAFMSTAYAGLIVAFFPAFDALINSFSGGSYQAIFVQVISTSVDKIVGTSAYVAMAALLNAVSWTPSAYFTMFGAFNNSYSFYYAPQSVYSLAMVFAGNFVPILISAILSISAQFLVLSFLEKTIYIFIGLALFLRAFVFTRRMGSTLMGVFLGAFLFLKLALVFEAAVFENLKASGQMASSSIEMGGANLIGPIVNFFELLLLPLYLVDFCLWFDDPCLKAGPWMGTCYGIAWTICWVIGLIVWVIDLIVTLINLFVAVFEAAYVILKTVMIGPGLIAKQIAVEISIQIASASDTLVFGFFMPIFNVIFVIAGIKALVEAFGGDEAVVNMLTFI